MIVNWKNINVSQDEPTSPDFALDFSMCNDVERDWFDSEPDDIDINGETTDGVLLDEDDDDVSDYVDRVMDDVLDDFGVTFDVD